MRYQDYFFGYIFLKKIQIRMYISAKAQIQLNIINIHIYN